MIRGIYKNSSALQLLENKQEVISHNLANVVTAGYKKRKVAFRQLIDAEQAVKRNEIDVKLPKGEVATYLDSSDGALHKTENPFDIAIQGEGFFAIQSDEGEVYTRSGKFQVNEEGKLTTSDGYEVLGESGPIELSGNSFDLNSQGQILQDGMIVNKLKIANFDINENVSMVGNYFKTGENTEMKIPDAKIFQGYVEHSNVNVVEEMTKMIMVQRHYESNNKAILSQDGALKKSVNDVGR